MPDWSNATTETEAGGKGPGANNVVNKTAAETTGATENSRETGTVSWWRDERGWGSILPDDGGSDIFCHSKDLQETSPLTVGSRVSYRYEKTARGVSAKQVQVEREKSNRLYGKIQNYDEASGFLSIDRYDGLGNVVSHKRNFQGGDEPLNGIKVSFILACSNKGDTAVRIQEDDEIPETVLSDRGREFGIIVGWIEDESFGYVQPKNGGEEAHLQSRVCTNFSPKVGMCISFVFEDNDQGPTAKDARQEDPGRVARKFAPRRFGIVDFYADKSRAGLNDGYGFIVQHQADGASRRYVFHMDSITTPDEYGGIWPPLCVSFLVVPAECYPHGVKAIDVTVVENPDERMEEEQQNFLLSTMRLAII